MKTKNDKIKFYLNISLLALCFVLFLVLAILVMVGKKFGIDQNTINFFSNHRATGATKFIKIYTYLGSFYCLAIFAVLFFFLCKDRKKAYFLLADFALVYVLSFVIKHIVCRARPLDTAIISEDGYSFPSGHSSLTSAVCGLIIFYICKFSNKNWVKILSSILLSVFVLSVGATRLYLGVHYFTDVVAGFLLGLVCVFVSIVFYEIINFDFKFKRKSKVK